MVVKKSAQSEFRLIVNKTRDLGINKFLLTTGNTLISF